MFKMVLLHWNYDLYIISNIIQVQFLSHSETEIHQYTVKDSAKMAAVKSINTNLSKKSLKRKKIRTQP